MYHQLLETISKIVYGRQIRHVESVGRAATMAKEGHPEDALAYLAEIEKNIHPKVRSVLAFTRAKIMDGMGRETDAEAEMIRSAKIDPANFRAHLEIARMCGRRCHFENARARLRELASVGDETVKAQAKSYLAEINNILSGEAERRLTERAARIAQLPLGLERRSLGLPLDLNALDAFIESSPDEAAKMAEDLAILLGESAVVSGGRWHLSLSLLHCVVRFENAPDFNPFQAIAYCLAGDNISILKYPPSQSK